MAADVIDLLSSSPAPSVTDHPDPPFSKRPFASLQAGNPSKRAASPQTGRGHPPAKNLWPSIDLCVLDDSDELSQQQAKGSKRPRVSNSPPKDGVDSETRPYHPPLINNISERRTIIEAIEFTSSIDLDGPEDQNYAAVDLSIAEAGPARASKASTFPSQHLDPFTSSPPSHQQILENTIGSKPTAGKENSSVSLISSPIPLPRRSRTPDPRPLTLEFSDPFASSPVLARSEEKNRRGNLLEIDQGKTRSRKEWDPISSSAPEQTPRKLPSRLPQAHVIDVDSDNDPQETSDEDELPDIANFGAATFKSRRRSPLRRSQSDILTTKQPRPNPAPKKSVEQRALEKEAKSAAKAAERERKQKEKEEAKEARLKEKERATALAEVNRVRTDKKVSTPEMVVMMPSSIDAALRVQIETLLDGLSVQFVNWDSPAGNAFKWRRKVTSRFDEELGRWEPIPLQMQSEKHALIILTADELVELTLNDNLDSSIQQAKGHFPGHEVIYILQGINTWMRKNRNIRNRQFANSVRQAPDAAATQSRRRNRPTEEHISEDLIEDAMLRMQVEHEVLMHNTESPLETAQWVVHFTQHISTIPYKKKRDEATSVAGFCMESGQVRTGDDARDVYLRMLQEIMRVTAPIAHGIAAEFNTVGKLIKGLESGGPSRLEGLRKSANKDGAFSDRTVGQAVSRRVYRVFTGRDESSTDV